MSLISFVGHVGAAANTAALPAIQAQDLVFVFAFTNATTIPSLPAGYTNVDTKNNSNVGFRVGYKFLTGVETDIGIWTNATHVRSTVLRGVDPDTPIGGLGIATAGNSNILSIPGVTLQVTDGTSWVVCVYGHDIATTSFDRTQTGVTVRSASVGTPANLFMGDANAVSSFSAPSTTTVNGSGRWAGGAYEIRADVTRTMHGSTTVTVTPGGTFTHKRVFSGGCSTTVTSGATLYRARTFPSPSNSVVFAVNGVMGFHYHTQGSILVTVTADGQQIGGRIMHGSCTITTTVNGTFHRTSGIMTCQKCGCAWNIGDEGTNYFFRGDTIPLGSYTSPKAIYLADEDMQFCPKCDTGLLRPIKQDMDKLRSGTWVAEARFDVRE